jgi:hypothetical protein
MNNNLVLKVYIEYIQGTDPEVLVLFSAPADFLGSSVSGTGLTQPLEYNRGAT